MSKFCKICDNLLTAVYAHDELAFKCNICQIPYKSFPEDTLRHERVKESDVMIFDKIMDKAAKDPVTIKAKVDCINNKCDSKIVKQVRVGSDMKLYNICIKCEKRWVN